MIETLHERWARQDAFIGPQLPSGMSGIWETRADREVFASSGRWWAKPLDAISAQGPFPDILTARRTGLT